jgi:phosphoribosylamine--glycine ligase
LEDLDPDVLVFHAGTGRSVEGRLITSGGRVLTIVATGDTLAKARDKAYRNVERVRFAGAYYRRDIASVVEPLPAPAAKGV